MHLNAISLFKKYGLEFFKPGNVVLEIGPDRQLHTKKCIDNKIGKDQYEYYYTDISEQYIINVVNNHWNMASTNLDSVEMTHYIKMINEYQIDCEDNRFDVICAFNVIEHVRMPWIWLGEIARLIKQGGVIILTCPGITQTYHREPVDCWRIWPDGFQSLFDYTNINMLMSTTEHVVKEPNGYQHIDTIAIGVKL